MSIIQKTIDELWNATLFKVLPNWIKPNFFTFLRFISIPIILLLLAYEMFVWVLIVFALAALLDSIDGALARTRKQISNLGFILDPIADKMLIMFLSLFLIYFYPYWYLLVGVVIFDLMVIVMGFSLIIIFPDLALPDANFWGKFKMVFQVLGIIAVLFYFITNWIWLLTVSILLFLISLILGTINLAVAILRSFVY